jgi:protein CpxP
MTLSRRFLHRTAASALLAACVAATCADAAFAAAQAGAPAGAEAGPGNGPQQGFGGSRPGAPGLDGPNPHDMPAHDGPGRDRPPHGPGGFGLFGRLHRLDLSEAQEDKLFALTHAAAPQQRNQEKAERSAHDKLRALGGSERFDEARANAAARELGQAIANGVLLRARLESQVLAVLTPEQREQLRQDRPPGPQDRP